MLYTDASPVQVTSKLNIKQLTYFEKYFMARNTVPPVKIGTAPNFWWMLRYEPWKLARILSKHMIGVIVPFINLDSKTVTLFTKQPQIGSIMDAFHEV